jgi:hypothetical protein
VFSYKAISGEPPSNSKKGAEMNMADNYLCKYSTNPTSDVENPPIATNHYVEFELSHSNNAKYTSIFTSKAAKLALSLAAVGGAAAIGVALGLNNLPDKPVLNQDASTAISFKTPVAESKDSNKAETKSIKQPDLIDAVSHSITNRYETCSDLEKDITEALKPYFTDYINNEAENKEIYASCDPNNIDWWYENVYVHCDNCRKYHYERRIRSQTANRSAMSKGKSGKNRRKWTGSSDKSGFGQNSQNDNVNEKDKVVSDGKFIYAAYGDALQAWPADDSASGVSITQMPRVVTECDGNSTKPCTHFEKPSIQALFLSNDSSRLTVVVSQYFWEVGTPASREPPSYPLMNSNGSEKLVVRVYDTSGITPGAPLFELASKELVAGWIIDGGSIGGKVVIATGSFIESWTFVQVIDRWQPQYCGLNKTSYTELATSTAEGQVKSLAKQMVTELELFSDCSNIFQVSSMQDVSSDDVSDLTVGELLLGHFVQIFTLDVASAGGGNIPSTVAGSFSPPNEYALYMTDDFIALPYNIYEYDNATGGNFSTFIPGFGISADGSFEPSYYGYIPGEMSINYRMDKVDGSLRIVTSDDPYAKIYVLDLPAAKGHMSVLGESENLLGYAGLMMGSLFSGDQVFLSGDESTMKEMHFVVADLSDQQNPKAVGSLQVRLD